MIPFLPLFPGFPQYCLLPMRSGWGNNKTTMYYFNVETRRCEMFTYHGRGGNTNRFHNLHQCHTECGGKMSITLRILILCRHISRNLYLVFQFFEKKEKRL